MTAIFNKIKLSKNQWRWLAGLVVLLFIFALSLAYIVNKKNSLQQQISAQQSALPWMYQAASRIKSQRNILGGIKKDKMTLASRVSFQSKKYGLKALKLTSSSNQQVILSFTTVNFVKLHDLIFNLEQDWNVKIRQANIKKVNNKAGLVSGSLSLVR